MENLELTSLINKCYQSVKESIVGPITIKNENGTTSLNNLPFQVFLQILGSQLPHLSITTSNIKQTGNLDMKMEDGGDKWKS